MFTTYFYQFLKLFSDGYKLKLFGLFILSTLAGFLEFFGIAFMLPLIILILDPSKVSSVPYIKNVIGDFSDSAIILCSAAIIFAFILKNIFMIIHHCCQTNILKNWSLDLTLILLKKYLFSSYESKLSMPAKYSILQVSQICEYAFGNFVSRVLTLISSAIILSAILSFCIWKFRYFTILAIIFFVICGHFQNKLFKTKIRQLVQKRIELLSTVNNNILSAIRNIKDIKIFARENYFYSFYKQYQKKLRSTEILINIYDGIPQNIIEICIVLAIVLMCLSISVTTKENPQLMIASLGTLAAAMFRIAPLVNKIQTQLNNINANKPYIIELFNAYKIYNNITPSTETTSEKFKLKNSITIKNLSYSYQDKKVLNKINAEIKKGEFIGIVGESGVGKTTFADILMGLLPSYDGEIFADNERLYEKTAKKWINSIGYVPQEITLFPASLAQNIAFGVNESEIDYQKIAQVIKSAHIEDYVNDLPNGVNTVLDNIQNMSQGQKQRIGFARALYKEPEVLILDEFTSALDIITEDKLAKCLNELKGQKTIIAIAHRLSTLKNCDRILYFKTDKEILTGTFKELEEMDSEFKTLISLSTLNNHQT